jgi:hypothetical protein
MGISYRVEGFVSGTDPTYIKHAKVLKQCIEEDLITLPEETAKYFNCKEPLKHLLQEKLQMDIPSKAWNDEDCSCGYEISVKDIPEGTEKIIFTINY